MNTRVISDKDSIDKEDQVLITSENIEELEQKRLAEEAGRKIIEDHLKIYLKKIGNDKDFKPTFIGWLAHLHPENVKIDSRLDPEINPYNPHKVIYDHVYNEYFKKQKSWFGRAIPGSRKVNMKRIMDRNKKTKKNRKKIYKKKIYKKKIYKKQVGKKTTKGYVIENKRKKTHKHNRKYNRKNNLSR